MYSTVADDDLRLFDVYLYYLKQSSTKVFVFFYCENPYDFESIPERLFDSYQLFRTMFFSKYLIKKYVLAYVKFLR